MAEIRALTQGPLNHFFGYYGVNPWDRSMVHHLALETTFHEHRPGSDDSAKIGLVDSETHEFRPLAETRAFNLQQGSMMHWIDVGFGDEFTYNDWDGDKLVSRALCPETGRTRTIQRAVAAVSPTDPVGIGLNFTRMAYCRPVVGYANEIDPSRWKAVPDDDGLFHLDLRTGRSELLLSIADVVRADPCEATRGGLVWFNHVYYNTTGTRLLFLCRVKTPNKWHTAMWSVNSDGSDLECQIPYGPRTSHFAWQDASLVMVSTSFLGEMQFLRFTDRVRDFEAIGAGVLPPDGHNAFSPDRRWVVCDRSPKGPGRLAELMLYNVESNAKVTLGRFYAHPQFTGDIRCDLHPRWRPDGKAVTFDSVHEGPRQVYIADVSDIVEV